MGGLRLLGGPVEPLRDWYPAHLGPPPDWEAHEFRVGKEAGRDAAKRLLRERPDTAKFFTRAQVIRLSRADDDTWYAQGFADGWRHHMEGWTVAL